LKSLLNKPVILDVTKTDNNDFNIYLIDSLYKNKSFKNDILLKIF
jgi:hypothetical protein